MSSLDPGHFVQPESFAFDAESEAAIATIVKRYPAGKQASAVIPLLYVVQRQMNGRRQRLGADKGMDAVAERLGMPPIRVYEVATFYFMFNMKPIGQFHLQVCGTTPCWLRGSDDVTRACKDAGHVPARPDQRGRDVHHDRGRVPRRLRERADARVDDDYYEDMDYDSTVTADRGAAARRAAGAGVRHRPRDQRAGGRTADPDRRAGRVRPWR